MDVKPLSSTQAAQEMHAQNIEKDSTTKELENETQKAQKEENVKQDDELAFFKKLDEKKQKDLIEESIKKFNEKMDMMKSQLRIETDKDTGIRVVKIVDSETKEVIRQIPPEYVLKIAKYIDELTGVLFEKKV